MNKTFLTIFMIVLALTVLGFTHKTGMATLSGHHPILLNDEEPADPNEPVAGDETVLPLSDEAPEDPNEPVAGDETACPLSEEEPADPNEPVQGDE